MIENQPEQPTPQEASARIKNAEEMASSGVPMEELVAAVKYVHRGCRIKLVGLESGKRLFRAVRVSELPIHRSRVGYPPASVITQLGRANDVNESLFYASIGDAPGLEPRSNMLACVWECKVRDGDLLAVGEWEVLDRITLYPFGFQAPEMSSMIRGAQSWIQESTPAETMAIINAWESDEFTRIVEPGNEHEYRMSIALTKYSLGWRFEGEPVDRVDGVVYPSVAARLNCDNICLTPQVADNKLALLGVRLLSARNLRFFRDGEEHPEDDAVGAADVTLHESSYACDETGEIKWPPRWITGSTFTSV